MTGPLAPLFAQVREAHRMVQVAVSFSDGPQRVRWNEEFQDTLSSIERHVQDMDALVLDMREWMRDVSEYVDPIVDAGHPLAGEYARLLARLSRLGAGDSNQNEKEQT